MSVPRVPFAQALVDISAGNRKILQSSLLPSGSLAVVDQGHRLVAGYTNIVGSRVQADGPVIVFGDHTRAMKYVDFPFAMGADGVKVLCVRPGFDPKFVYHFLRSCHIPSAGYSRHFKFLKEMEVPGPPLDEQRRIAAILDHADAVRAKRDQLVAALDKMRTALFYDFFGDPRSWPSRWPMGVIDDLAESVQYGTNAKAGGAGEWPILRMGNVTDSGRLDLTDVKYIDLAPSDVPKYTARRGDMLFNRTNSKEKVGKTCVVHVDDRLAIAGYLVRVRFRHPQSADFVSAYMTSRHGLAVRQRRAKAAVNQANINASEMRAIPIAIPPQSFQDAFAEQLAAVEGQRNVVLSASTLDNELSASLQARAFRGEL